MGGSAKLHQQKLRSVPDSAEIRSQIVHVNAEVQRLPENSCEHQDRLVGWKKRMAEQGFSWLKLAHPSQIIAKNFSFGLDISRMCWLGPLLTNPNCLQS